MIVTFSKTAAAALAIATVAAVAHPAAAAERDYAATVSVQEQQAARDEFIKRLTIDETRRPMLKTLHLASVADGPREHRSITIDRSRQVRADLSFAPGRSTITENARFVLRIVADALRSRELRAMRLMIGGHTDASGSTDANQRLSEDRALAVKTTLVEEFGIAPDRLVVVGFGETALKDAKNPESAENRRIELTAIVDEEAHDEPRDLPRWRGERFIDALWQSDGWIDPARFRDGRF